MWRISRSDWKRPTGHPHSSWLAIMKNDRSYHNLRVEDATELALDRPTGGYWQQTLKWCKPNNNVDDVLKSLCYALDV